jgi:hypothetical protein
MANGIDERHNPKRRPSIVEFDPVGLDAFAPKANIEAGTRVRIASSRGVKQPAKGYEYIENPETGEYLGVASTQSLKNQGTSLSDEE